MRNLSHQEMAILLGTRASENCQTIYELSLQVEAPLDAARETIDSLVTKGILKPVDSYDGIRYGYQDNDLAQGIYAQIHRVERFDG